VNEGKTMENAKHLGGMWALAVALGVGLAVANAPAVASAAPGDSDKGSSSDESSSRPSGNSGSTSSDSPSVKGASSTDDGPSGHRRPQSRSGKAEVSSSGGQQTRRTTGSSASEATTDDHTARPTSGEPVAATTVPDMDVSPVVTPTPTDPPSRGVSTLINVDPPKVDNDAPPAPVRELAALTVLTGAGRESEQANTASTTVDPPADPVTNGLVTGTATSAVESSAVDPGFISSTRSFFGLFSLTSAGDPDDNNFVAVVFQTPFFTNVLTSGTDPEDNLGFGAASIGVAGQTVNTFISPFLTFSIGIPVEDPFAELFIELIRLGLV
jgi:hypothetical protein